MPYGGLGLGDPKWTDDQLLDFMMRYPILINRPIVATPKGVRLCRPSETVLDILPNPNIGRLVKEDGGVVDSGPAGSRRRFGLNSGVALGFVLFRRRPALS